MDDERTTEYVKEMLDVIERCGHVVQYVFDPDDGEPPFAYTIGLCTRPDHPYELAVAGFSPQNAHVLLNRVPEVMVRDGIQPCEGVEIPDTLVGLPPKLRRCVSTDNFTIGRAIYGGDSDTWQVLCPDEDGRYPGDPGFAHAQAQVLL